MKRATKPQSDGTLVAKISIHALVKRATEFGELPMCVVHNFNPRPREEGDFIPLPHVRNQVDFNPRPREEGDSVVGFL